LYLILPVTLSYKNKPVIVARSYLDTTGYMKYEQLVQIFLQEKPTVVYLIMSLPKTDS